MKQIGNPEPKDNNLSSQILRFFEYMIVVMLVHISIFAIMFFITSNEEYLTVMGAILISSFVIFLMNYDNNPYPMDDLDMFDLMDSRESA